MTSPQPAKVVAIVYGSRRYGFAVLSSEHLYRAEVKCLARTRNPRERFRAQLVEALTRTRPSLVCEVIDTTRPGRLQGPARQIVRELTRAASLPLVTLSRDELRRLHHTDAERPTNNEVGRLVLREYPELAARYGAPETLGRTSYPTSRERYLYFLYLAVAGARAALYAKIL